MKGNHELIYMVYNNFSVCWFNDKGTEEKDDNSQGQTDQLNHVLAVWLSASYTIPLSLFPHKKSIENNSLTVLSWELEIIFVSLVSDR